LEILTFNFLEEGFMNIWQWLSGKKTIIGAVCLWVASVFIPDFLIGELHLAWGFLPLLVTILMWIGGILVPTGIAHKAIKANVITQ
jgi:hypothetical protein